MLSLLVATFAGGWVGYLRWTHPEAPSDVMPVVWGAQAWLTGQNPYTQTVRPEWPYPLLYPFPAVLLVLPVANWPPALLNVAWVALGAGLLAWAVTRERLVTPALAVFVSVPFIHAVQTSQWTPLLTAAMLLSWGGFVFACKPTTALWLFAYAPRVRHALTGGAALVVSLIIWPAWPWAWQATFRAAVYTIAPITLVGGVGVLLALLRWRRPEARLLVAMACVPHTTLSYETLPLFLVPKTWMEAGVLWVGTLIAVLLHQQGEPYESPRAWVTASGTAQVWCAYLPTLIMILRRPNVSDDR